MMRCFFSDGCACIVVSFLLPNEDFGRRNIFAWEHKTICKMGLQKYKCTRWHRWRCDVSRFYGMLWFFCNNFMLPKRRFWKDEQKMKCGFSKHFSRAWVLNLAMNHWKVLRKSMLPKRRFWKSEPTFPDACSKQFSKISRPNRVLTPLKSASKTHSERLVQPSKIFVWEG